MTVQFHRNTQGKRKYSIFKPPGLMHFQNAAGKNLINLKNFDMMSCLGLLGSYPSHVFKNSRLDQAIQVLKKVSATGTYPGGVRL
jgi:hypothetical protein